MYASILATTVNTLIKNTVNFFHFICRQLTGGGFLNLIFTLRYGNILNCIVLCAAIVF
jgi:hypothetical protein